MLKAPFPLSVVIHGHFYQPPREDPWLETLERQPSAAPYHDWNQRIVDECYRAVLAARVPGPGGRIAEIVNTLQFISFNFGPTLLEWLESNASAIYRAILESDQVSRRLAGDHGNALAQPYHHTILPLASRREKVSEVRWGIRDFRRRFGRDPSGMWLPETAVDGETLDVLAQEGIAFTILAPHQVKKLPASGLPGTFRTSEGRAIALFVYDGPLSHGVAFGAFLKDAEAWVRAILDPPASVEPLETGTTSDSSPAGEEPGGGPHAEVAGHLLPRRLVSMATDGETFGHHHGFGEMALAAVIRRLQALEGVRLESFASFLARTPPEEEVELMEPSSWSCVHGVERWRSNCGCKMDHTGTTQQEWRWWLREAVDRLADEIHGVYEEEAPALMGDPWNARDRYGEVAGLGPEVLHELVRELATRNLQPMEEVRARELLDLEHQALRLFTSCGWFFDDLAGLEPLQIMRYAARALELTGPRQAELEEGFLSHLDRAFSNEAPPRSGREIFLQEAKPRLAPHLRMAAGAAAWELVGSGSEGAEVPGFHVARDDQGLFRVTHRRTGRQWMVEARARRPSLASLEVQVRAAETHGGFAPLALEDMPEGYGDPIRDTLLGDVLERWVSPELREGLALGTRSLARTVGEALTAALRSLGRAKLTPVDMDRVRDLADLHGLLKLPIPFDAQTEFYRLLEKASPQDAPRLSVLREPLGFVIVE